MKMPQAAQCEPGTRMHLPSAFSHPRLATHQGRRRPLTSTSRAGITDQAPLCFAAFQRSRRLFYLAVNSTSQRRRLRSLPGGRAADAACSSSRGRRGPRLRGKAASGATRGASLPAAHPAQRGARPALTRRPATHGPISWGPGACVP